MKRRSFLQVGLMAASDVSGRCLTGELLNYSTATDKQDGARVTDQLLLPRSIRQTGMLAGNGGKVYGPFDGFHVFDVEDIVVWSRPKGGADFEKVAVKVVKVGDQLFDIFTIEFSDCLPDTTEFVVSSERVENRLRSIWNGRAIDSDALEEELSKQATVLQELRRDVDRSIRVDFGASGYMTIDDQLDEGSTLVVGLHNRIIQGPRLSGTIQAVVDRSAMKATMATSPGHVVFLTEAGREGDFILRAGSLPLDDRLEGVYIASDFDGHYWERIVASGDVPSVRVFGAILDGTVDDSASIAASLSIFGAACIPWTPSGFVAGGLTLGTNQKISAERKTIWRLPANAPYGVRVESDGAGAHGVLENFLFDLGACPTTTTAIRFGTSTGNVFGFRGRNLDFRQCGEAIGDEVHETNYVVDVQFTDCYCYLTRGRQIFLRRSRGFITVRDVRIDHTFNIDKQVTWEGARFENFTGLELEKFDVVGPMLVTPVVYQETSIGLVIAGGPSGKASVWLTRVLVDNTRGPGIDISGVFNLFAVNTCSYQNLGIGMRLTDVTEAVFANTVVAGSKGVEGSQYGTPGLLLRRVRKSKLSNTQIKDCDGHGVVIADSSRVFFTDLSAEGCTGLGYCEMTGANLNIVKGASYLNNRAGNFIQSGTRSMHTEWINDAGVLIFRTVGPTRT